MSDLGEQFVAIARQYTEDTEAAIRKIVTDVGKEALAELRKTSPKRTGKYSRGWRMTVTDTDSGAISMEIRNRQGQLTHLLENGHRTRNKSGWVEAQPHIAQVQSWAEQEAQKRIEDVMKGDT